MDYQVIPGPRNPDVLHMAHEHRASRIFARENSSEDKPLLVRRSDQNFFKVIHENPIDERVMHYIEVAGFKGVFDAGFRRVDHALITALIEIWRPETHTFHLKIGEATVTLQDIQVLWGLNVDGPVISGDEILNFEVLCYLCQNCLGFTPKENHVRGSSLYISKLVKKLKKPLPEQPTVFQLQQRARMYILVLIGGTLFPDKSGGLVPICYLSNLENLEECRNLSWGSAVLAYLYRCLCKASNYQATEVAGPLVLLQLWAWERFRGFRPEIVRSRFTSQPTALSEHAYGVRFVNKLYYLI